jgi:hypothetical protein
MQRIAKRRPQTLPPLVFHQLFFHVCPTFAQASSELTSFVAAFSMLAPLRIVKSSLVVPFSCSDEILSRLHATAYSL